MMLSENYLLENAIENNVSEASKFQNDLEAFLQKIHKRLIAHSTEFPQFASPPLPTCNCRRIQKCPKIRIFGHLLNSEKSEFRFFYKCRVFELDFD